MTTAQNIIDFLNSYNPTGVTLAPDQFATFATDLKSQINQLSIAVPGANADAVTVLYSGTIDGTSTGTHTGAVAEALANQKPGAIRIINQTQ